MSLLDYIRGNRKGKAAHRLEKESMRDPFLSEAIEGYDSVTDDHIAGIEDIQKRLKLKSASVSQQKPKKHGLVWTLAAACSAGVLVVAGYLLFDNPQTTLYSQETSLPPVEVIDIYVPSAYYESHEEVIEDGNNVFEKEKAIKLSILEEDGPISIYVPSQYYEENKETIQKVEEVFPK